MSDPRCGAISAPTNGGMTGSGDAIGSTRTFTCNSDYKLTGEITVRCEAAGNGAAWSASPPTCQGLPVTKISF